VSDAPTRVPPLRLVRAIDRVRAGLMNLHRTSVPGNIAMLELASQAGVSKVAVHAFLDGRDAHLHPDDRAEAGATAIVLPRRSPRPGSRPLSSGTTGSTWSAARSASWSSRPPSTGWPG